MGFGQVANGERVGHWCVIGKVNDEEKTCKGGFNKALSCKYGFLSPSYLLVYKGYKKTTPLRVYKL